MFEFSNQICNRPAAIFQNKEKEGTILYYPLTIYILLRKSVNHTPHTRFVINYLTLL